MVFLLIKYKFEYGKTYIRMDGQQTSCLAIVCEKKAVYEIIPKQLELFTDEDYT